MISSRIHPSFASRDVIKGFLVVAGLVSVISSLTLATFAVVNPEDNESYIKGFISCFLLALVTFGGALGIECEQRKNERAHEYVVVDLMT